MKIIQFDESDKEFSRALAKERLILPFFAFPSYRDFSYFMWDYAITLFIGGILDRDQADKIFLVGPSEAYRERKPPWKRYKWDTNKKIETIQKAKVLSLYIIENLLRLDAFELPYHCRKALGFGFIENTKLELHKITIEWVLVYLTETILVLNRKSEIKLPYATMFLNYVVNELLEYVEYSAEENSEKVSEVFVNATRKYLDCADEVNSCNIYSKISDEIANALNTEEYVIKDCVKNYFLNDLFLKMDIEGIAKFTKRGLLISFLKSGF